MIKFFRWTKDVLEKLVVFNVYFKLSKGRFGLGVLFILTYFVFKIPPKHDVQKKWTKDDLELSDLL